MSKTILLYGLSGYRSDRETNVIANAIKLLGFQPIIVLDKPSRSIQETYTYVYTNPTWSYEVLETIAREHSIDLALLVTDFASPLIGHLNDRLNLPGPGAKQYDKVAEKLNWYEHATQNGLVMPTQTLLRTHDEYTDFDWQTPFIVKPTKSTANISHQDYGYEYFENCGEFKNFLESRNLVEDFLAGNQHSTPLGRYIIQERVDHHSWNNGLSTIINNQFFFHEMHTSLFYPFPHHKNYYATYGPLELHPDEISHVEKIGTVFENLGLGSTPISFDIIRGLDGNVYTLDVNVRASGTFTLFEPLRDAQYFSQVIETMLGQDYTPPGTLKPFLRRTVTLPPGKLSNLDWPTPLPEGLDVDGYQEIKWPVEIKEYMGRFQWPLEVTVTGPTIEDCFNKYARFEKSLQPVSC